MYTFRAEKTGYLPSTGTIVELADNEKVFDAKIPLARVANLSGTLRDESGDPIVGTIVFLLRRTVVNGRPTLVQPGATRSDDRGLYRFGNLAAGDYIICACLRD